MAPMLPRPDMRKTPGDTFHMCMYWMRPSWRDSLATHSGMFTGSPNCSVRPTRRAL